MDFSIQNKDGIGGLPNLYLSQNDVHVVISLQIFVSKQCKPRGNAAAFHLGLCCFVKVPIIDFQCKKNA